MDREVGQLLWEDEKNQMQGNPVTVLTKNFRLGQRFTFQPNNGTKHTTNFAVCKKIIILDLVFACLSTFVENMQLIYVCAIWSLRYESVEIDFRFQFNPTFIPQTMTEFTKYIRDFSYSMK